MRFFRRKSPCFDLAAIGDRWDHLALAAGMSESMSIRRLPADFDRGPFGHVALVQPTAVVLADQFDRWTAAVHFALERDSAALLALVHRTERQVTWYAYAATRAQLDDALATLAATNPVRWAINADREWSEYEHARAHADAPPAMAEADAPLPDFETVPPPVAPSHPRCSPIETPLGYLAGRDRVHVSAIRHDPAAATLVLSGDIAGDGEWIGFDAFFADVAAIAVEDADASGWTAISDLYEVASSPWAALDAVAGRTRRHVVLQAHDDLFHVACSDMRLVPGDRRRHAKPSDPDIA